MQSPVPLSLAVPDDVTTRTFTVVINWMDPLRRDRGTPAWTGLSTNATCQPEKPENSHLKTWGSGLNPGVVSAAPRDFTSNRRESTARKNLRNVADTGAAAVARCCQENHGSELGWKQYGSPAWIRTTIHGSKGRCPTIRQPGIYRQFSIRRYSRDLLGQEVQNLRARAGPLSGL